MLIKIHIGAHRTATTHLQQTLEHNKEVLNSNGIAALTPKQLRGSLADEFQSMSLAETRTELARSSLQSWCNGKRRVVISEENLLGTMCRSDGKMHDTLYPNGSLRVVNLVNSFPKDDVGILLCVRNPVDFVKSVYGFGRRRSRNMSFKEFLAETSVEQLRWSNLVLRLSDALPKTKITIWRYEEYQLKRHKILHSLTSWKVRKKMLTLNSISNPSPWNQNRSGRSDVMEPKMKDFLEELSLANKYERDIHQISQYPNVTLL